MDLKTIAPDSRTAVIERKEFKGGGQRRAAVGGWPPQTRADRIGRMPIGRRNFWRAGLNEVFFTTRIVAESEWAMMEVG